jgi:hypothetical protein
MAVYKKVIDSMQPETLVAEFHLIWEKKSKLSKDQRDYVIERLNHLIKKGVITFEVKDQNAEAVQG